MSKIARTIRTSLPTYKKDRQQWRKEILENVREAAARAGVLYEDDDLLEVEVLLYLTRGKRHDIHDVDNRLKDILDALQGRFGGPKSGRSKRRVIENDRQVCRVLIEKQPTPKRFKNASASELRESGGRLLIRPYSRHTWPLQKSKSAKSLRSRRRRRPR